MSIREWQRGIGEWGDATFPSHHAADGRPLPAGPVYHLVKEAEELRLAHELDEAKVPDEVADVIILALTIAHLYGFSAEDAVAAKMERNRRRRWGPPDEHGACQHLGEESE